MTQKGRPQGGKNRQWSKEEKARIVQRYFDEYIGEWLLAKEESVSRGMLHKWIQRYMEEGQAGLENKKKTGNHFSALHTSKSLSEEERLRLTVAKQQVEIARLKNGHMAEGNGADKVYVTLNGVSIKSSKK